MNIGFTSTSFRQIKSIEKIVKIASDSGADCIEWGGDIHIKDIPTAKRAKKLCDDAGIIITSYGSYYRVGSKNADKWKKICEIASAMGAKSIRVWLGSCDSEITGEETYNLLVEDGKAICSAAAEYNLVVCPECHDNTFNNNTDAFLKIHRDIGCDNFRTYFQSRYKHLKYDLDRIERTLPYVESVHISYSEQSREQFPILKPGYINSLLDKIISLNFDGNILVEYTYLFCWAGLASSMKKSIAKIKAKVGKIK
ncbi:MAG: sugar phosphate isomerase/epimerase [Ruminococcaceae bacterium]|nr:sugar phosphate isomerase/epimerase [Oscillospiraceae bacterium]